MSSSQLAVDFPLPQSQGVSEAHADSTARHASHDGAAVYAHITTFRSANDMLAPMADTSHHSSKHEIAAHSTGLSTGSGGAALAIIRVESDTYPKTRALAFITYLRKFRGGLDTALSRPPPLELFFSWLGAFLGILLVAGLNQLLTPQVNLPLLVASFGASAVLIFGVVESKMAQPRNFIGGQLVSALVGCSVRAAFPQAIWLSTALGMSLALVLMQLTCTTHPPGGATALIASSALHLGPWRGFQFVLTVLFGCLGMLVVALVVNNLSPKRRYPTFWW